MSFERDEIAQVLNYITKNNMNHSNIAIHLYNIHVVIHIHMNNKLLKKDINLLCTFYILSVNKKGNKKWLIFKRRN